MVLVKQFRPGNLYQHACYKKELCFLNISMQYCINYHSLSAVYYNSIPAQDRVNTIDVDKYPASLGITLELCAGIVDKSKSLAEIAAEEMLEECGYKIDTIDRLEPVIQFRY